MSDKLNKDGTAIAPALEPIAPALPKEAPSVDPTDTDIPEPFSDTGGQSIPNKGGGV